MCNIILTAGLFLIVASSASCYRLVCYYDSLAETREHYGRFTVSDIDPNKCTHMVYSFSDISHEHELVPACDVDKQRYPSFNSLKSRNLKLKTLLAVGGPTFDTRKFSLMVATRENRLKFIQSTITLLRTFKFDGINLDWRNPRHTQCQQKIN